MSEKIYRFGDHTITVEESMTDEEVRNAWKEMHPSLESATVSLNADGEYEFHVQGGTKG